MGEKIYLKDNKSKNVELSKVFKEDYLDIDENPELLMQPILTTNILLQIIIDLKNNMFHTDDSYLYVPSDKRSNQLKMNLWQDEFINTDKNEIKKVYKTSQFLKNYDKKLITKSLDFLKNYKNSIYSFENSNGKKITTSGGLIKDWYFSDKTGNFEITISLYWANKIVTLERGKWNNLRYDIIEKFRDPKQRFFILWLISLKKYSGTKKNYQDILDTYNLNYPSAYELIRGFLEPIKKKLDNKTFNEDWISFNHIIDDDNINNIKIIPYDVKPDLTQLTSPQEKQIIEDIEKAQKETLRRAVVYKTKYIKRRHNLSKEVLEEIKKNYLQTDLFLFEKNYKKFRQLAKQNSKKASDYIDNDFLNILKHIYEK